MAQDDKRTIVNAKVVGPIPTPVNEILIFSFLRSGREAKRGVKLRS